jgi:hypothetical protein
MIEIADTSLYKLGYPSVERHNFTVPPAPVSVSPKHRLRKVIGKYKKE